MSYDINKFTFVLINFLIKNIDYESRSFLLTFSDLITDDLIRT